MIRGFKKLKNESGQAMVIFAVSMVVLLGFVALAVDTGSVALTKSKMQNATDAAALAAAQDLPDATAAQLTAEQYAELNGVDGVDITLQTPYQGDPTKALITCTQTVNYTFAKVLGKNSKTITTKAVAQYGIAGSVPWIVPFVIPKPYAFNYDETYVMRMYGAGPYPSDYTYPNDFLTNAKDSGDTTYTYSYKTENKSTILYQTTNTTSKKMGTISGKNTAVSYVSETKVGTTTWYQFTYSNFTGWTKSANIIKTQTGVTNNYPYQFDYMNVKIDAAQSMSDYLDYLENGYHKIYYVTDNMKYYAPSSGGKESVDRFALRINRDSNTDYTKAKIGDGRVMLIPVVNTLLPRNASVGTQVEIIGFAAFFLEKVYKNSYEETFWFEGRFLEELNIGSGQITIDPNADFGLRVVNLIE
jgi:Flp pilus assembly protein TadG